MSMSLAELRKELREARKTEAKPVSRMKKHEVALELERRKGAVKPRSEKEAESSSDEEVVEKVKKVLKKAKVPEAVVKKAEKKVEKVEKAEKVEKKKPVK